jgi:transcriptional regulator with XRE-family HTH domain
MGDTPAGARRRVRIAVRRAREAKGLTQSQVAEEMEWSLSKVMRIESGEVTVALNDLRPLLGFLGVTDQRETEQLIQAARQSRQRQQWWDQPRLRERMTPAMRQLIQYETEAPVVRYFYPMVVPGRLQTEAYANAVLRSYADVIDPETIAVRLEIRARRRAEFLARKKAATILLLLDQSVLLRQLGGPRVLADQLEDLRGLSADGRIVVRIVPFTVDAPLPLLGTFEILYLHERGIEGDGDAIMYHESDLLDEIVEDDASVKRHLNVFERLWHAAHDETTSARLLEEGAKSALASADEQDSGPKAPGE